MQAARSSFARPLWRIMLGSLVAALVAATVSLVGAPSASAETKVFTDGANDGYPNVLDIRSVTVDYTAKRVAIDIAFHDLALKKKKYHYSVNIYLFAARSKSNGKLVKTDRDGMKEGKSRIDLYTIKDDSWMTSPLRPAGKPAVSMKVGKKSIKFTVPSKMINSPKRIKAMVQIITKSGSPYSPMVYTEWVPDWNNTLSQRTWSAPIARG